MPKVSVIIPVLGAAPEALFRALDEQTFRDFEIIVVGNDATPLPPRSGVSVLHEPTPGSYAARNRGVRHARGEIIAFTDADCLPDTRWLDEGVRALGDDDAVAGRVEVVGGGPRAIRLYESASSYDQRRFVTRWRFGATCNLFARRAVFARVGLFDARLKSGGDFRWGRKVARLGYAPSAIVRHPTRGTLAALAVQHRRFAGGYYDIRLRKAPLSPLRWAMGLVPSATALGPLFLRRDISLATKGELAGVIGCLAAVRAKELVRLFCGAEPARA